MRGCQESGSSQDVDRADVLVVSQGSFRRADNPLPQLVLTILTQILYLSKTSKCLSERELYFFRNSFLRGSFL